MFLFHFLSPQKIWLLSVCTHFNSFFSYLTSLMDSKHFHLNSIPRFCSEILWITSTTEPFFLFLFFSKYFFLPAMACGVRIVIPFATNLIHKSFDSRSHSKGNFSKGFFHIKNSNDGMLRISKYDLEVEKWRQHINRKTW